MPYVLKTYDYEASSTTELVVDTLIDLVVLVIFTYYLQKLLACIPFIFAPLNKKYISSFKGEVSTGIGIGSGIILYTSLFTIKDKLKEIDVRIKANLNKLI